MTNWIRDHFLKAARLVPNPKYNMFPAQEKFMADKASKEVIDETEMEGLTDVKPEDTDEEEEKETENDKEK